MNTKNPKNQKETQKKKKRKEKRNQKFVVVYVHAIKESRERKKGVPQKKCAENLATKHIDSEKITDENWRRRSSER